MMIGAGCGHECKVVKQRATTCFHKQQVTQEWGTYFSWFVSAAAHSDEMMRLCAAIEVFGHADHEQLHTGKQCVKHMFEDRSMLRKDFDHKLIDVASKHPAKMPSRAAPAPEKVVPTVLT